MTNNNENRLIKKIKDFMSFVRFYFINPTAISFYFIYLLFIKKNKLPKITNTPKMYLFLAPFFIVYMIIHHLIVGVSHNLISYREKYDIVLSVMMLLLIINYSVNLGLSFCKKGSIWYPIIHVFVIILLDIILMFKEGIFKQKKQIYEDPILLNQDEYTTQEEYNVVEEENNF